MPVIHVGENARSHVSICGFPGGECESCSFCASSMLLHSQPNFVSFFHKAIQIFKLLQHYVMLHANFSECEKHLTHVNCT